ncbi:alanine/glycine:cation symporter family protein [Metabacillus iocasae]|uniref:Amino acid carrier protein n=1 Tax=Priestia iocasae TaxID=2291674 RepID=A0ABS2R0Y0_9BACI|nr:alanine/glycine:cation symporter family protein [Metabacillus iocasae]MBM7704656.1 amino acid carrier protein [Metabacillus iocasae]
MDIFEPFIGWMNNLLWSYILIGMLITLGLYFTIRTNFVQFRLIKEMVRLLGEGATATENRKKGVTSFQAFAISTASRVGTGNLAGVALAISTGGPGAIFWMWLIALIGAASAFVESTLAQIYKVKDKDSFRGGPAYYMEKGLNMRWMGVLFAVLITICFGLVFNAVQANTITSAFDVAFGTDRLTMGIILAVAFAAIIFGGIRRIARISEIIVVVMALIYIGVALIVIIMNIAEIPGVISLIVKSAFGLEEAVGGTLGAALMMGIKRGLFSNEAGMGSAPNAAATATVSHPVKQGLIQSLGVFTDTIIICSCTAFIILLSNAYVQPDLDGIQITQAALSSHIGEWATQLVAITILLFAFSSLIGNYYYGETNIEFLNTNKSFLFLYRIAVVAMVIFGSVAKVQIVWDMADLFMGLMAIVNLIAIFMLGKIAFAALNDYMKQKKAGKDPVFYKDSIEGIEDVECWNYSKQKSL